jgi:hypothetical protein
VIWVVVMVVVVVVVGACVRDYAHLFCC